MGENIDRPPRRVRRAVNVARPAHAALVWILCMLAPSALAQATLGDVLDAGATLLTPEDFKREVVPQRLVGQTAGGGRLELVYGSSGSVTGMGAPPANIMSPLKEVEVVGEWFADGEGRICTTIRFRHMAGWSMTQLPRRCQYWFKAGDAYFLSDYDSDRGAKVLRRTVKQ